MFTPSGEFGGFQIYFDSLGRRSQLPEQSSKEIRPKPQFAFLGDSFTEALQVPYDSSFIGILANTYPDAQMLNYGVTGYGAILYYLQCKKMIMEHGIRPRAIFMILYSNDVRDDSTVLSRAKYDPGTKEIIAIDGGTKNSFYALLRRSYTVRGLNKIYLQWKFSKKTKHEQVVHGFVVNNLLEETPTLTNTISEKYILKTDSFIHSLHIPFYITAIPSRYKNFTNDLSKNLFAEKTEAWCNAHKLTYINLQKAFDSVSQKYPQALFYKTDVHCNGAGQKIIGNILSPYIKAQLQ